MQLLDIVTKNSTDRSVTIRICDSTDGTPETGVEHNTAGIDLWYRREGAAKVSITEAALTALTDAHSDGGIEHIGDGYYRLDLPDAAFATGANYVDIGGTVTDMIVFGGRVRLVDYSLEDSVRMGLSALPNAAAGAAGGLPTDSAGKTSFNDIAATAIVSGGAITTSGGAVSSVTTVTGNVGGNVVGSVASVTAGVTLANTAHGGAAASLTLQTLTVSNSAGNAVVFESTGGSGHGLCATGDNGGSGIVAIGGSTGYGLLAEGGATTGHGAYFLAHGAGSYGALFYGGASGAAGAFFDSSSAGPGIAADITGDLTGNVSGSVGSVTGNVGGSVGSVTGGINTGAGTITTLDALDTAQDTQHSTTQSAISGLNDPTAAAIADAVWDEATSGHATAGTTGKALTDVLADTNELQTNQGNWLTATGFSTHSAADVWTAATRTLTAATNITSDGSAVTMSSSGVIGTVNLVNTTTTNTDMRGTDNAFLAASAPANFSDLAITVTTGRVDVGSIEGLDATDQIRDAVVDDATRIDASALNTAAAAVGSDGSGLTEAGGTGDHLTGVPWNAAWDAEVQSEVNDGLVAFWTSPATLVDLVWDEATSGHTTAGTTGKALTDAGSAGDPWTTALPGAYSAGTAGYLVGTYLDAAVSGANTVTPLDAAGIRTAVGLAAANLDTQLGDIPTVAEFNARTLAAADYFNPSTDAVATVTTVGTVNALAANSVNASALAADAVAEIGTAFLATALSKGTAGTIERAFWQILKTQAVVDGEVAGTPTASAFDTNLTADDGVYNHLVLLFTSGSLEGEARPIDTYVNASGRITLQESLSATPTASDEFIIVPQHVHPVSEIQSGLATSAEITALNDLSTADVDARLAAYGSPTKAEMDSALAALNDLSSADVAGAVWNAAIATYGTSGSYGELVETNLDAQVSTAGGDSAATIWSYGTRVLTAATNISGPIADQVWEETLADHSATSGSTAFALNAAGAAGDPWSTTLPGAYGAGTAGYLIGTYVDSAISGVPASAATSVLTTSAESLEDSAPTDSLVAQMLMSFNSAINSGGNTLTVMKLSDDTTFATFTVTVDTAGELRSITPAS